MAQGNSVVGKIFSVTEHTSSVLLLTDSHSRIIAEILAKNSATGVIHGEFQLGLRMDLIPITQSLQKNMIVVTSGLEEGIPPGLLIGTIEDVSARPSDLYQSARIRPSIHYDSLRLVSVVAP